MFKVNNKETRTTLRHSGAFIINFEHISSLLHCVKTSNVELCQSGPYFSVFGLNTNTCYIDLCIQIESGKIKTRRNYVFGYFSHNARVYFEKNSKNESIIKLSFGHIWIGRISIYPLFIQKGFHKWENIKHNNLETCDAVICLTERSSPKLTD